MPAAMEILQSSIVCVGAFNPTIFSPDWLEHHKLIGEADADAARNADNFVVSKQGARFGIESWDLQVLPVQFSLASKGVLTPAIQDLGIGLLSLVPHTPITAVGLNFEAHYRMEKANDRNLIGDKLSPKDIWLKLLPSNDHSVGTLNLTMLIEPCKRGEEPRNGDRIQVAVQPSLRVKNGVLFSTNYHYALEHGKEQNQKQDATAAAIIEKHWEEHWKSSLDIFEKLLQYGLER